MEILLNKSKNKVSRNEAISMGIDLESTGKVISRAGDISNTLSLLQLYRDEADACNKYRFIVTVNPICSNVLYNVNTEIVNDEGSDECKCLNFNVNGDSSLAASAINTTSPVTVLHALDDTEYTSKDIAGSVYHCGVDIFSNHRLRSTGFNYFKAPKQEGDWFNTISTYLTDNNGNIVKRRLVLSSATVGDTDTELHAYNLDNIISFKESYKENLREVDGWYGFYNKGTVTIPNKTTNGKDIDVNRVINNNKQCEFIDLYPDRSLFSFIPKLNKSRNRIEKNWDYCITYPYKNDFEKLQEVGITDDDGFIFAHYVSAETLQSGSYIVHFKTTISNNLDTGDFVYMRILNRDSENGYKKCIVYSVGDSTGKDRQHYFSVRYREIASFIDEVDEEPDFESYTYSIKRVSGNLNCVYYFRKFRKLGNYKSEVNKIVGGKNIYGDPFAQIIFTDDIIADGSITNNLGMPVTDLYLTIVKRNAGHNEWYQDKDCGSSDVEYSHCFGEVTSGLRLMDVSDDDKQYDYNIYRINGLFKGEGESGVPEVLESDITIDNNEFYGDIVEFNPSTFEEVVLERVFHRFNTAQREIVVSDSTIGKIQYNDIVTDDLIPKENGDGFYGFSTTVVEISGTSAEYPVNLNPEGYFYNPHYLIKIREKSNLKSARTKLLYSSGTITVSDDAEMPNAGRYIITGMPIMKLIQGDELCLITEDGEMTRASFIEMVGNGSTYDFYVSGEIDTATTFHYIYKLSDGAPSNAIFNPTNATLVWRTTVPYSQLPQSSELSEMPFSNGSFYRHLNINFFLRRQDPVGENGLKYWNKNPQMAQYFTDWYGKEIDLSDVEYFYNDLNFICY